MTRAGKPARTTDPPGVVAPTWTQKTTTALRHSTGRARKVAKTAPYAKSARRAVPLTATAPLRKRRRWHHLRRHPPMAAVRRRPRRRPRLRPSPSPSTCGAQSSKADRVASSGATRGGAERGKGSFNPYYSPSARGRVKLPPLVVLRLGGGEGINKTSRKITGSTATSLLVRALSRDAGPPRGRAAAPEMRCLDSSAPPCVTSRSVSGHACGRARPP